MKFISWIKRLATGNGEKKPPEVVTESALRWMASDVQGTEAIAFQFDARQPDHLKLLVHIRSDDSDLEQRKKAVSAFQDLVAPCIRQQKDGAIKVGAENEAGLQFCLVHLLATQTKKSQTLVAVIVRCENPRAARERLRVLQLSAAANAEPASDARVARSFSSWIERFAPRHRAKKLTKAVLTPAVRTMAVQVQGMEAIAFKVNPGQRDHLNVMVHIRADNCDLQRRKAAVKAFQDVLAPCIEKGKDGAIEVGQANENGPQYCLVHRLANQEKKIRAIVAVIVRCSDLTAAVKRLRLLQMYLVKN
jgi:hypothetical protein